MNDRFRFRVWHKQGKKFFYGIYPGSQSLPNTSNTKAFVLEQCTGLKDKKGRLIYEGDVVKRHSKYDEEEKDCVLQVEWNYKSGRYITTNKKHDTWFFSMFEYEYEVIGNIHKNPELREA